MNAIFFLCRLIALLLFTLVCSIPAFCGEIHDAAKAGDLSKIKTLLKKDPDFALSKDSSAWTPLHYEARAGCKEAVKLLLAKGSDVNAKTNDGKTALFFAARGGYKEVVELLLAKGADINAKRGNYDDTALHSAAAHGHKAVVELLLANKAAVNARDGNGATPLHKASESGHKDVMEILLAKGADVNAMANNGNTPLHMAMNSEFKRAKGVAELLRQHGGHEQELAGRGATSPNGTYEESVLIFAAVP
jgi:ankyrin repeat protein